MSFQPTYSYLTNRMTMVGSSTPAYDANGNATNDTGGWPTLPRGTEVNTRTTETRGGAESFLRLLQKRFGF